LEGLTCNRLHGYPDTLRGLFLDDNINIFRYVPATIPDVLLYSCRDPTMRLCEPCRKQFLPILHSAPASLYPIRTFPRPLTRSVLPLPLTICKLHPSNNSRLFVLSSVLTHANASAKDSTFSNLLFNFWLLGGFAFPSSTYSLLLLLLIFLSARFPSLRLLAVIVSAEEKSSSFVSLSTLPSSSLNRSSQRACSSSISRRCCRTKSSIVISSESGAVDVEPRRCCFCCRRPLELLWI